MRKSQALFLAAGLSLWVILSLLSVEVSFGQKNPGLSDRLNSEKLNTADQPMDSSNIFEDKVLLEGYTKKFTSLPKYLILEMINDDALMSFKSAAAVRVFNQRFSPEMVSREKGAVERVLIRRLNRSDSPFVQVEIMHGLLLLYRYRYFKSMVPALIQKMGHYNATVNEMAFTNLYAILVSNDDRGREARIVFNTLRKMLFLSRRRLEQLKEANKQLSQQLTILKWSIKILGTEELKKLPKEVIHLL